MPLLWHLFKMVLLWDNFFSFRGETMNFQTGEGQTYSRIFFLFQRDSGINDANSSTRCLQSSINNNDDSKIVTATTLIIGIL